MGGSGKKKKKRGLKNGKIEEKLFLFTSGKTTQEENIKKSTMKYDKY